jgi:hypothetical protein
VKGSPCGRSAEFIDEFEARIQLLVLTSVPPIGFLLATDEDHARAFRGSDFEDG